MHDASALDSTQAVSEQRSDSGFRAEDFQRSTQGVTSTVQNLSLDGQSSKQGSASPSISQSRRPISKAEQMNPRDFQINQLRRRFRPQEEPDDTGTILTFGLVPSDPDFPFELDSLQCLLHVPHSYPEKGRPTLTVTNPEMDSAFQANVARGFDDIVMRTNGRGTLLNWMNSLDRQLERLLTTLEKGPKLKFVANTGTGSDEIRPADDTEKVPNQLASSHLTAPPQNVAPLPSKPPVAIPNYTIEEKVQAEKRRANDTKQIEARLGRLPLFQKRSDGSFVVPIQPNKQDRLPRTLQAVKTVKLNVPQLYPLERSSIQIQVDSPEARAVELGFAQWIEQNSQMNLVSQINYLASNMHNFANTPLPDVPEDIQSVPSKNVSVPAQPPADAGVAVDAKDRPHLHVIPRPPEWSVPEHSGDETTGESSYESGLSEEDEDEDQDDEGGAPVPATVDKPPGRGVALSFPFLELYGIELLELVNLCITVKCERCKESLDVKNVPQVKDQQGLSPKTESCKKCANPMSIGGPKNRYL